MAEEREFIVTVRMTKLEEQQLEDTIVVKAVSEEAAIEKVEEMEPDTLDLMLDDADPLGFHEGWFFSDTYSVEVDEVTADEIVDEEDDAALIMDVFYANTQSPAPWPGQCPAGEHKNENGDCVA